MVEAEAAAPSYTLLTIYEAPGFFRSTTTVSFWFGRVVFPLSILVDVECYFIVLWLHISLMTSNVKFSIFSCALEKCLFKSLANILFTCFLLYYKFSLLILNARSFSGVLCLSPILHLFLQFLVTYLLIHNVNED